MRSAKPKDRSPDPGIISLTGHSNDWLFSALDESGIGIGVLDRRLRYANLNTALAVMHNLPQKAHIGKTLHEVLGLIADRVAANCEHVFSTGRPLTNVQLVGKLLRRPDVGHWLECAVPVKDASGRVIFVSVFVMEMKLGPVLRGPMESALKEKGQPPEANTLGLADSPHAGDSETSRAGVALSPREQEVLRFVAVGKSTREISSMLGISIKTVEAHRSRVMLKIGAPSIVHLIHYAIRRQIVEP